MRGIYVRARGSANGSLVCYLLGITDVDPVKWSCLFERFLTMDRSKPPDIDLDIDKSRRDEVVDYLQTAYGAAQISNFNTLGIDAADRGSLMVKFLSMQRHALGAGFASKYGAFDMLSMPPATSMSALPAASASCAMIAACMPLPHILLIVVAGTLSGKPAPKPACRAGA